MNNRILQIATLLYTLSLQSTLYSVVGICLFFSLQFQYLSFTELQHCHQIHESFFCGCYFYWHLHFDCSKRYSGSFSCECVFAVCTAVPNGKSATRADAPFETKKTNGKVTEHKLLFSNIAFTIACYCGLQWKFILHSLSWINPSIKNATVQCSRNAVCYGNFHAQKIPSVPFPTMTTFIDFGKLVIYAWTWHWPWITFRNFGICICIF